MILFLALALASPLDVDQDGFDASVDCDDADPAVHPEAIETCDAEDDDCDGAVDEASLQLTPAVDPTCAWHGADRDLDGYGDAADAYCLCAGYEALAIDPSTGAVVEVEPPEVCLGADGAPGHLIGGVCYVLDQGDCDDVDGAARPGGPEALDGLDDDCDGALPIVELDCDADGAPALPHLLPAPGAPIDAASLGLVDCGALASAPAFTCGATALTLTCDPASGLWTAALADLDAAGLRPALAPDRWDCDDACAARNTGAAEVCDGIDDDCDLWLTPAAPFSADLDGVPDTHADTVGGVAADEIDADGDGALTCADPTVGQTEVIAPTCASPQPVAQATGGSRSRGCATGGSTAPLGLGWILALWARRRR